MSRADWFALVVFTALATALTIWFLAIATGPHPYN